MNAIFFCMAFSVGADWKAALPPADKVAQYLQDVSVTIKAGSIEGSGVIKTRDIAGAKTNFVWTAAHVIDGLRSVEEVIDPGTGTKRQAVKFADARIVKELVENGRRVGELTMDAAVVRFSKEEDLALLRVRKTSFVLASVVFCGDGPITPIGTDLYHVGSLLGQMGSNSMTTGIVSQIGRTIDNKEFDQTTATSFPGSSGGGIFLKNGGYVGMIVRGAGEGFNLAIPLRRIGKWAARANVVWAIDDSVPMPSEDELLKLPIEETGRTFDKGPVGVKEFPTLIRRTGESPLPILQDRY